MRRPPISSNGPVPESLMEKTAHEAAARVQSSHWWFEGRRRILQSLLEGLDLGPDPMVVEVGCGTGANAQVLRAVGRTIGLDASALALAEATESFDLSILARADRLPLASGSADLVCALDVVEHLDDDLGALEEMVRVLRPGGRLVVFVPAFQFLWGLQDEVSHHRRRYRRSEISGLVAKAGTRVLRSGYFNFWLFGPIALARILWRIHPVQAPSENLWTPKWVDGPLAALFGSERHVLARFDPPFGVSAYVIAEKE